ncbi:MAG: putative DNA-binding protein [Clostridia bacterium]|nr:putative DNA-binding protein [Clostridia bacterium]
MDNKVKISILLETYGKLLTDKQYNLLDDYYNMDLSLSEIAENENITRQAVRDNLKKGENKLFEYEEKLGIMKKTLMQEETISTILSEISKIEHSSSDKEIANILQDVKNKLNCLV